MVHVSLNNFILQAVVGADFIIKQTTKFLGPEAIQIKRDGMVGFLSCMAQAIEEITDKATKEKQKAKFSIVK